MGPDVQYALQDTDGTLTICVYRGADGSFSLYEDDGVTYAAERGEFSRIPFTYTEAGGILMIAAREGAYPGMRAERTLNIEWIGGPTPATTSVTYSGSSLKATAPD